MGAIQMKAGLMALATGIMPATLLLTPVAAHAQTWSDLTNAERAQLDAAASTVMYNADVLQQAKNDLANAQVLRDTLDRGLVNGTDITTSDNGDTWTNTVALSANGDASNVMTENENGHPDDSQGIYATYDTPVNEAALEQADVQVQKDETKVADATSQYYDSANTYRGLLSDNGLPVPNTLPFVHVTA